MFTGSNSEKMDKSVTRKKKWSYKKAFEPYFRDIKIF